MGISGLSLEKEEYILPIKAGALWEKAFRTVWSAGLEDIARLISKKVIIRTAGR